MGCDHYLLLRIVTGVFAIQGSIDPVISYLFRDLTGGSDLGHIWVISLVSMVLVCNL